MRFVFVFFACTFLSVSASAQNVDWSAWKYYVGEWTGSGSGKPGQGEGGFTFSLDLQESVLIRKNFSEFPATQKAPAYRHDDLMVIYPEGSAWAAEYYDNEKHVIHYAAVFNEDSTKVIFTSKPQKNIPGFRLTYTKLEQNRVKILFEFAPPAELPKFTPYIEAEATRKN